MEQTQKLTAYKVYLHKFRTNDVMEIGNKEGQANLQKYLDEFLESIKTPKKSSVHNRALKLEQNYGVKKLGEDWMLKSTWLLAGQFGKQGLLENLDDERKIEIKTSDIHFMKHYVFFFINESEAKDYCYFIFHRYSTGGCKTVFFRLFRNFLNENYDLNIKESAVTNLDFIIEENLSIPEIKLIRHTSKVYRSSDQSENLEKINLKTNSKEYETIFYLNKPTMIDKAKSIFKMKKNGAKIKELKEIVELKNVTDFDDDYIDYKVRISVFGKKKWVSIDEIENLFFEYDITELVKYKNEYPTHESVRVVAIQYFDKIKEDGQNK